MKKPYTIIIDVYWDEDGKENCNLKFKGGKPPVSDVVRALEKVHDGVISWAEQEAKAKAGKSPLKLVN